MSARVLLCVPIMLLLAVEALAQCRVEGLVRSATGTPLANATVRIDGPDYRQPLITTTDAEGRYVFAAVKPGARVRIVALQGTRPVAQGFALVTLWVENVDLNESPPATLTGTEYALASEGPSGEVAGTVWSADGRTVPSARITIAETTLTAVSDSAGRYAFGRLRPGVRVQLQVSAAGFEPTSKEAVVPEGNRVGVDFALADAQAAEFIGATLSTLDMSTEDNRISVLPDQIVGVPSLGRKDVFRALQFLPGVAASLEASGDLYVRGGSPDQTLVTFDGFTLYQFADAFGSFSAFNMDTVQKAEFSKSAFGAANGGRLSGALRLAGQPSPSGKASGFVDVSMLGLNALVNVPVGDKVSFLFAGRTSPPTSLYNNVLDMFATESGTSARDRAPRFSGGPFPLAPAPSSFHDLNGRMIVKATSSDRLTMSVYDGRDDVNDSHDLAVPAAPSTLLPVEGTQLPSDSVVQVSRVQNWTARGLSGTWFRQWSPSASTTVSIGRSDYFRRGDQSWLLTSPATATDYSFANARGGSSGLSESNRVQETTARVNSSLGIGFEHALSIGGELSSLDVDYAAQSEVFRTTAGGSFTSRLDDLLQQSGSGRLTTVYAQDAWRPSSRLILSPGVRVTRYDRTGAAYFEPRVSASYQLLPGFSLTGGWAIDHQMINRLAREDRVHGDGSFWALADGLAIPVARSEQFAAGGRVYAEGLVFDVEAYDKTLDDLTLFAPRLYTGISADAGQTLLYRGSGRARGLETSVQSKVGKNTVWASYTLSQINFTYPALEAAAFPASYDQTHELKITDTVQLGGRWSLGGAWVASSGRPYTPARSIETVWFPTGAVVNQLTFDAKNSARLPVYHRLDVTTQRDFVVGGLKSSLGVTVFNVYDKKNTWLYEYETAGQATTNEVTMMGRAVNAFIRVGF